jgi:CheY-like chemotaxis protein
MIAVLSFQEKLLAQCGNLVQGRPLEVQNHRILCVDDDAGTLKARRLLLEAAGYSVLTANSGEQVLDILAQGERVDLVLLDFAMGAMDGDELARNLRKRDPELPLIVVSANEELPAEFMKMLDGRVRKGQNPEVLLSTVSSVLANSRHGGRKAPASFAGTVLCIDDEQLQLQLRTMLFEAAGFKVLQARSASLAMEIFRTQQVDAVVMDYWLSGTNGTTIAEEMKRLQPRIPIVMLSGYSSLPGEGAVVDAWLRKAQVEPEEIVNAVKRLIGFQTDVQRSS